jgi:hypothetical protein
MGFGGSSLKFGGIDLVVIMLCDDMLVVKCIGTFT